MLSYEAARAKVIEVICARHCAPPPPTETIEFAEDPSRVLGRIVAEDVRADRNYPPFNRSTRDGFALRAADAAQAGAKLRLIGESRAGVSFGGTVEPGTCVQIMTGAAMPRGANSIVMNEHARIEGEYVVLDEAAREGAHFVLEGQETRVGESVIARGKRLSFAELAIAAQVGRSKLVVAKKPRVAILSTGDELVAVEQTPTKYQIRNSNNVSLAAQVALAGGEPVMLGTAPDNLDGIARANPTGAGSGYRGGDRRRVGGEIRFGRASVAGDGRGILFRCGGDSSGKAGGFRILPRQAGIWVAGKSGFDDGDVRAVRGAGD